MNDEEMMLAGDHYAVEVLGGDVPGLAHATVTHGSDVRDSVRRVVQQAQRNRLPPPALTITPASAHAVVGEVRRYDALVEVLGLAESTQDTTPAPFSPIESSRYPIAQRLYRRFKGALPPKRVVRVDTEASYQDFMAGQRAPHVAELEARLAELERLVAVHTADNHGGGRLDALEQKVSGVAEALAKHLEHGDHAVDVAGEEVEAAREKVAFGGTRVPLSLAPWAEGKIDAWRNGDEIYCSVRLPGPDGCPRIATSSTPVERHLDEVMNYADEAGVNAVEILGVLHGLAEVLGGGALVTQICCAAPGLLERPEAMGGCFVGVVTPAGDPAMAAAMALLQLCQKPGAAGADACYEVEAIKKTPAGAKLIAEAQVRLKKAQSDMNPRSR
jgi:hypothetical protein